MSLTIDPRSDAAMPTGPAPRDATFVRALDLLAVATQELRELRGELREHTAVTDGWSMVVHHLLASSDDLAHAASVAGNTGNTVEIIHDGEPVRVGLDYVERMTDRLHQYTRRGRALGIGGTV